MPRRKTGQPPQADSLFDTQEKAEPEIPPYAHKPFHPSCTVKTTFGEIRVGDVTDYWGQPWPIINPYINNDGRVYIRVQGPHGQQFALGPATEVIWRQPRSEE